MKRICLFLLLVMIPLFAETGKIMAQTSVSVTKPSFSQDPQARFRLFPTQNTWIFLELDTQTGRIWIVQYSTSSGQLRSVLSTFSQLPYGADSSNGRFTLYATSNMFNFIMVDQVDGRTWQVQWSIDGKNDLVIPIGYGNLI